MLRRYKDPAAQLLKLAQQQSDVLLQKLGRGDEAGESPSETRASRETPSRLLPFGSEMV